MAGAWEDAPSKAGESGWEDAPSSTASAVRKAAEFMPGVAQTEAALALGTGAIGGVTGGLAGIAGTILPGPQGQGADWTQRVANAVAYEPRTQQGQQMTRIVGYPGEMLSKAGDYLGGGTADLARRAGASPEISAALGAGVNTMIQAAPMALSPAAKAIPGESAASIANRARMAALKEKTDAVRAQARKEGIVLTPEDAEGGIVSRVVAGLSGEPKLAKSASKKNAPTINDMIRRDVGVEPDIPLSRESIGDVIKQAGNEYEVVNNTGKFGTSPEFRASMSQKLADIKEAAAEFEHRGENPLQKVYEGLNKDSFTARGAVREVRRLREDSDKAYRAGDKEEGKAYKEAAHALDNELDRHLREVSKAEGSPELADAVSRYRAARVRIAKGYAALDALNETTGNIDARVYARALRKGAPLTGEALRVGQFGQQFPRSMQPVERLGSTDAPTYADAIIGALGGGAAVAAHGVASGGLAIPLVLARPGARAALQTEFVQNRMNTPHSYGPSAPRSLQQLIAEIRASEAAAGMAAEQEQARR